MNIETIFTVKNEDLGRLGSQKAVDFFRELVWAEATALGIGKNLINVPSAITVADGGIDAEVKNVDISGGQGLIKKGLTRYQIKSGEFSLRSDRHIKDILFKSVSNQLKPRIKSCLDRNGTLIIVLFGSDNPERKDDQVKEKFRKKLIDIDQNYSKAKIEIFWQNKLIGFLQNYPSLALKVTGRGQVKFQTHKSWSKEAEMSREFKAGKTQKDFIFNLQNELRKNEEAIHLRISGESGIGKTRLALEATRIEDLESLIIYCENSRDFRNSNLMNELLKEDNHFFLVLVIDECDSDNSSNIWNKFKHQGQRIKIISIYSDFEETSGNISYFEVPSLGNDEISGIIQGHNIPKDQADKYVEYCGGSPRVAHVLGQNLINNPEDLLKSPDTVKIWDRYIVGSEDPNSLKVIQRRLVLRYLALFKRFGYDQPIIAEAQAIWKKIEQVDTQITWPRFEEIILNLRRQKSLQGEYTLYISPKALHIKLWTEWWETHGTRFDFEEFLKELPQKLIGWFFDMFKYAAESEVASRIIEDFLGDENIFQKFNVLETKLGAEFFLVLTEANPNKALVFLKNTIGTWAKDKLLKFTIGRRHVISALEKIVMWKDLFSDGARLLLVLGEAENETYSNNASGVFAELFSPAYGQVAPTEAPPQERFPVLKEALESNSKERRILAIRACDKALESQHFVRTIGDESYGLKRGPQLWMPKTYGEIFDSYRKVWNLLLGKLDNLSSDEQSQAIDILLQRAGTLSLFPTLADMIIETVEELIRKPYANKNEILAQIIRILRYMKKEMHKDIRQRWIQIKDKLEGVDFASLMNRYVGMVIMEDKYDEQGNRSDITQKRIEELAQKTIKNKELLNPELSWLVTKEAKNGYQFGYALGVKDETFSFLPTLLEAQRNAGEDASIYFLGGYFRVIFEKDEQIWEHHLDSLAEDRELSQSVPELVARSGMTDHAALCVLNLARKKVIGPNSFRMFNYGGSVEDISEDIFNMWVELLLESPETTAISIAMELFYFYYIHYSSKHTMPKELALKILTHKSLFQKVDIKSRNQRDDYDWTEIGKVFLNLYPDRAMEIADIVLKNFGKEDTIITRFHSSSEDLLNEIAKKHPIKMWNIIKKYLGPPIDHRAYGIKGWIQGSNFLSLIPLKEIWSWVDQDIEKRARFLASFVPKTLHRDKEAVCLVRELLIRYGEKDDVRGALSANFSSEFWWGPASIHYQKKKEGLLKFRQEKDNKNVKLWIDEYVSGLDLLINQSKIREERDDF